MDIQWAIEWIVAFDRNQAYNIAYIRTDIFHDAKQIYSWVE